VRPWGSDSIKRAGAKASISHRAFDLIPPQKTPFRNDFDADGDWLKDLTIKIKNTSGKTITWMLVNLLFPDITKDGAISASSNLSGSGPGCPVRAT
jgi:hypothetical protein